MPVWQQYDTFCVSIEGVILWEMSDLNDRYFSEGFKSRPGGRPPRQNNASTGGIGCTSSTKNLNMEI